MKTHKVVKSEGINHGMNYTPITRNLFMKAGTEEEIRIYFSKLFIRAHNYATISYTYDMPIVTKSKNEIHYNTYRDTSVLFEIKKLTSKEINKYNKPQGRAFLKLSYY